MAERVLVTAGAAGIGLAIARAFLATGAQVFICDVDESAIAASLRGHTGLLGRVADIGDPRTVDELFADALSRMDGLDCLVNNAGVGGPRAAIEDVSHADWQETLRVNLTGAFLCLQHAARVMKRQQSGSIINISTVNSRIGLPMRTPYVVSKAGLLGLTRNAARELGPHGVRVNAILPGIVDNPRGRGLIERHAREEGVDYGTATQRVLGFVSMRTLIAPEEIADVAVFLASDRARHVTGQFISVDGNVEWES